MKPSDPDLTRQLDAFRPVSDCPIRDDCRVTLLPTAIEALRTMWRAIREARHEILMEFYTFEDVTIDGDSLSQLLADRLAAGVRLMLIYDGVGSDGTPDAFFTDLQSRGAHVLEFRSLNPFKKFFSVHVNDRDHRKILVVDGRVAVIGGVNLAKYYCNPRSAGIPPDRNMEHAYWVDASARLEGEVVRDTRDVFLDTWKRQGGDDVASATAAGTARQAANETAGGALACVEGSAPHEGRPLHIRAIVAALAAARSRVWLASGYFVPMPKEIKALVDAAGRGVEIDLVLPGISDVMGCVHAGRATYGKLLRAGIRIHEFRTGVVHAKVTTIDGVWTSIGSSNLDRRSAVLNNEVDAVVLDRDFAASTEAMLREWASEAVGVTLHGWQARSLHEHIGEFTALGWKRLM